jgi:excisionase family DNA binding protein
VSHDLPENAKPANAATERRLQEFDQLGRQISFTANASSQLRQAFDHGLHDASQLLPATRISSRRARRIRATKAVVEERRLALFDIVANMQPMTVRQVFYQATVKNIVEKTEAGYSKVQTDLALMRKSGVSPYEWLADNTRGQRKPISFSGKEETLQATARLYRKNRCPRFLVEKVYPLGPYPLFHLLAELVAGANPLDCGNAYGYRLIAAGELESYRDGRARKITVESIRRYIKRRLADGGLS